MPAWGPLEPEPEVYTVFNNRYLPSTSGSTDVAKAFDKIQYGFMINETENVGQEGTYLNPTKAIYEKPIASITLNREKLEEIQPKLRERQEHALSSFQYCARNTSWLNKARGGN